MSSTHTTSENWTTLQAYTFAVICLLIGIGSGWFLRGSQNPVAAASVEAASTAAPGGTGSQPPTAEQMKKMADTQAAPLLEQLNSDPLNADLLARIGNIYYDTQQYPAAIEYYQRVLKAQPSNTGVRTDLATALWYTGDADTAITEFNKALSYEPNKANTLFNLGVVKWQGKMDISGAVAAWQKLLQTNPNYENKAKVQELIAQAQKHSGVKPGTTGKPLPE
ncbi:MAG TPA: tetratricopeptide repeat protein [Terriglobales bacterium]|nr:tetratricopeptide repeat protein [Terriglobales bacterium]